MKQREIKFRAWDKVENVMHYPDSQSAPLIWLNGCMSLRGAWVTGSFHLMQYTGLKDKNGREIYDGDVIDSGGKRGSDGSAILYAVKWNDEAMGFDLQQLGAYCMTGGVDARKVLVIGNIYENPELIPA